MSPSGSWIVVVTAASSVSFTYRLFVSNVGGDMVVKGASGRRQADRSDATRAALLAAATPLFAARGFAGVGTEEIVRAAGVTRGALYHQFRDKRELFAAVAEEVEAEIAERIAD